MDLQQSTKIRNIRRSKNTEKRYLIQPPVKFQLTCIIFPVFPEIMVHNHQTDSRHGLKKGSISIPGHEKNTADELASGINNHFGAICSTLPSLNTAQLPAYLPSATPPPTITRSQAWKELSKVKAHKAPGPDKLPNQVLKRFAFEISEPFCDIMNVSLREGVVPVEWKQATVVPVPKVTPTPSMDKLRPVSLTPTLAKVAESFITRWMMADMESSLDHSQFGNRKGRSTNHYLV